MKVAVGITGASGAIYAERLLRRLLDERSAERVEQVAVVFTRNGRAVAEFERPEFLPWLSARVAAGEVTEYRNDDFFTPVASGSAGYDALVVVPCSMGAVGRIAGGLADDLIARAAAVMLKENAPLNSRTLILCPRETPLSMIHLRNLTAVSEAGGIILPAMPSFYTRPQTLDEAVDTVVQRILSLLGLLPEGYRGWQE
ncbi:UbiX family flavin prenyltransferase [uncultured Rikenella sp.]|uniref:UbiX family flavin prenyltransferase n=1 Tax=uncultured Rikenella sp. TaxID=368003 RepID=UPI0025D13DBA|nr:UbiX family flavin prenyltransferase [uncultured Rikenella sp.]